jgi:carbon monoxide dehydrogenase subunit G
MIEVRATELIDAPVDEAFAILTRVETLPEWLVGCREAWALSDDPYRVGGKVAHIDEVMGQSFEAHYEVVVWEPGERVVFKTLSGPFEGTSEESFLSEGDGTRVEVVIKGELRGALRFGEWAARRVAQQQLDESLQNAARLMEEARP